MFVSNLCPFATKQKIYDFSHSRFAQTYLRVYILQLLPAVVKVVVGGMESHFLLLYYFCSNYNAPLPPP